MPALLDPAAEARLQRAMAVSAPPRYLVGAQAQVHGLGALVRWLRGMPPDRVDPIYIPVFQRLAVPLDVLYDPALLVRVKTLYVPFWTALARVLADAPDVRLGLDWPPTPASLYDAVTHYLQYQGLLTSTAALLRGETGDLDGAVRLVQPALDRLVRVINGVRAGREVPVFGPVARASARDRGLCASGPTPSPYFMVVALGRDGRGVALLAHDVVGAHDPRVLARLDRSADGSYAFDASGGADSYPRVLRGDPMRTAPVLGSAVESVLNGAPWRMAMHRMNAFDFPDAVASLLLQARLPPPYYGVYFDECDAALLLAAAQGNLDRQATEALYPPRTLLQASAARVADDASYGIDALESGMLPDGVEQTVASYALMRACASDRPPGVDSLAPAAELVGLDPGDPAYRSSPTAFCGDVWTAIGDRVGSEPLPASATLPLEDRARQRRTTAEPPRSRQRLF
ncbi:hypothetical protein pdul_cds_100 [Pandoravirus dulcis]|uniref:Uncharacterized protein n=1 Tax=Pandoravirus dulcis TaxID=1349409 RepID=S4VRK4_9VIRU|nr:hypothetical protein pdul_cds_100 [Pandoravirus dulcis]AGO82005.1 hypothetical protein pdul_cds_100 [Pandoravirus dulcis]